MSVYYCIIVYYKVLTSAIPKYNLGITTREKNLNSIVMNNVAEKGLASLVHSQYVVFIIYPQVRTNQ